MYSGHPWLVGADRPMTPTSSTMPVIQQFELMNAGPVQERNLATVTARYPVAITSAMAALIDPADPHDPIARQFLPDMRELDMRPEERADPIGDRAHSPVKGLVHRYPDRVLLKLLHVCPVYCRFCFRREMVGPQGDGTMSAAEQSAAIAYIGADPSIWEVILTGGDPLMLSARRMAEIMTALAAIPHVKIVRLHSRVPVVDPARVTEALATAMTASGKQVYIAIHANHPREMTAEARGRLPAADRCQHPACQPERAAQGRQQ